MAKVTVQPSGQSFDVEPGEAVLTAALRQGVMLPYGCKNGACGSCKGKIVAGEVDYGHYHARVLTEAERAHGKAPRGFGHWAFCDARYYDASSPDYLEYCKWFTGSYADAKRSALAWFRGKADVVVVCS